MVEALGIAIPPLLDDPLPPNRFARWEPWPPQAAQHPSWRASASLPTRPGPEPVAFPNARL